MTTSAWIARCYLNMLMGAAAGGLVGYLSSPAQPDPALCLEVVLPVASFCAMLGCLAGLIVELRRRGLAGIGGRVLVVAGYPMLVAAGLMANWYRLPTELLAAPVLLVAVHASMWIAWREERLRRQPSP